MKVKIAAAILVAVIVTAALVSQPGAVTPVDAAAMPLATAPKALDDYLAGIERKVDAEYGLVPDTEKRILWLNAVEKQRTPYSLVYERIVATENLHVSYSESADEGQHVLAGNILSPGSNKFIAELVVRFVCSEELPTTAP